MDAVDSNKGHGERSNGRGQGLNSEQERGQHVGHSRAHGVSLLSLHPSPAPSTRSRSPPLPPEAWLGSRDEYAQRKNSAVNGRSDGRHGTYDAGRLDADADEADDALEPPTLTTYRTALRNHVLALIPALALILFLGWVSSTYADLSRHHHHSPSQHHPSRKPPLILVPLGAAAWLAGYAIRPLLWDLADNALWLIMWPFVALAQWWRARRQRRRQPNWTTSTNHIHHRGRPASLTEWTEYEDGSGGLEPAHGPIRAMATLVLSILARTLVLELLRVGSMALAIAVLDAATRRGHYWLTEMRAKEDDVSLLLSPYDNRFGAVLWTTVGFCAAEYIVGSYDVLRKLRLYHPSLWPSAMYADEDEDYADEDAYGEGNDDEEYQDDDEDDADTIDHEAALPRMRTRASTAATTGGGGGAGTSGIEAATSAAQAAVHAVRFFPRVFTHNSTKSSSSSAFTIRPGPVNIGGGGDGNGSAFVLPTGPQSSGFQGLGGGGGGGVRRRATTSASASHGARLKDGQGTDLPASAQLVEDASLLPQQAQHAHFSTSLDHTSSGAYGTFQTARSHQPSSLLPGTSRLEAVGTDTPSTSTSSSSQHVSYADEVGEGHTALPSRGSDDEPVLTPTQVQEQAAPPSQPPPALDPDEEEALQGRLAHALAILLAARERADLEETLGARLDVGVRPALALLWRLDGVVWNVGACLILGAAVAVTSEMGIDDGGEGGDNGEGGYETVPDLFAAPLLPAWLILTAVHTTLSLLWTTALPRLGFAPVSYLSLLLGMGLTLGGLAWWGVLI